jgi:hypothetical protein
MERRTSVRLVERAIRKIRNAGKRSQQMMRNRISSGGARTWRPSVNTIAYFGHVVGVTTNSATLNGFVDVLRPFARRT